MNYKRRASFKSRVSTNDIYSLQQFYVSSERLEYCLPILRDRHTYACHATFSTMKNEGRINVYVWADFCASTSRVDARAEGDATGGRGRPPATVSPLCLRRNAIDRLHGTATLHIDRGANARVAIPCELCIRAT